MINIDTVYAQIPKKGGVSTTDIMLKFNQGKDIATLKRDTTVYASISAKVRALRKHRLVCVSHMIDRELYFVRR